MNAAGAAPMHLVWFHHAGGHGQSYRAMAASLPASWRVSLIEYPGRGALAHLPALDNLCELAASVLPQVEPLAQGPLAFFGHSMGAMVAHEVARQMLARRCPAPLWLGASGHRAPQHPRPAGERLHQLPDALLVERLQRVGALPAQAITANYLNLMRTDLRACETHHGAGSGAIEALPCALSTFAGDADPLARPQDMLPWSRQVSGTVRHHVLPGGHFFLAGVRRRQVIDLIVQDIEHARLIHSDTHSPLTHHATRTSSSHHARFSHRHLEDVDRR